MTTASKGTLLERLDGLFGKETVSVFVGTKRKQFVFHKGIPRKTVPFFAKAFEGMFLEGEMQEMYLSDKIDDPLAYTLFSHWLYRQTLPAMGWNGDLDDINKSQYLSNTEEAYHNLYYLAEKWCVPKLKAKALQRIREYHCSTQVCMASKFVVSGYANTSKGSSMCRYLAECGAYLFSTGVRTFLSGSKCIEQDIWLDIIDMLRSSIEGILEDPDFKPESEFSEMIS